MIGLQRVFSLKNLRFLFIGLTLYFLGGCSQKEQPINHRLIFNCDGTDLLGNFMFGQRPLSLADVNAYVDAYANTQVTTFMMCSGSDYTYYRSKFGRVLGDDRNGTLDCGCDTANYKYYKSYFQNHLVLEKEGTDVIETSLRRAKADKMETFISYRMNDLHFADTTLNCPIVFTDFWRAHPEYWINENYEWHSAGALNFSHKEVRLQKLNMITEQLEKYGDILDGYDLDFMRFIVYFKSYEGVKNAPLMTDLVKAIKIKVDELSAKRGKKILLSARVPTDVDFCLKKGLDVKEWIRLGLLDFITIGVHYIGNPAMPVAKFKQSLGRLSIPVYASMEDGGYGYSPREAYSHGKYRGMASHILAQGGDGIYLFNYFLMDYTFKYKSQLHLEEGGQLCCVKMPDLLFEIGSLETLRKRNKIYSLDNGSSAAYGYKPETPLPLDVSPGNNAVANIYIGDDTKKDVPEEVILFLRIKNSLQFDLSVNGMKIETQKPEYSRLFKMEIDLKDDEQVFVYLLPVSSLKQGDNEICLHSSGIETFKVKRIELALKYGDVKTHGYF